MKEMQLLYRYNSWANTRIWNAAAGVTAEQFLAPASFPHGGLRSTLTHILFAEWVWRKRWEGDSPTSKFEPADFPTIAALHTRWLEEDKALRAFVEKMPDDNLNAVLEYRTTNGEPRQNILWQLMVHVVNHGTQHRSECAAQLTDLGFSPGDIDLTVYLREG
jgi:uncharacterized damage-inducible protein DinB